MANICSFDMMVCGEKENIRQFLDAVQQEGPVCMGRGAEIDFGFRPDIIDATLDTNYDEDGKFVTVFGNCKWSVQAALIDNALSMKYQKETGEGSWYNADGFIDNHEFLTLYEACERFHVNVEIFTKEPGCQFAEHILYQDGEITEECEAYAEACYDEEDYLEEDWIEEWEKWNPGVPYDAFEMFKRDNGIPDEITEEEVMENDGWVEIGGFTADFEVKAPDETERDR